VLAYHRCRRLLHEQVGVAPSGEMHELYRQLMQRREPPA
jgi:DNA-binding SARP family transcriptional activator